MRIEISFGNVSSELKELRKVMAVNQEQVLEKLSFLQEAIVAEKEEVKSAIGSLEATVAELKDQIAAGVDLSAIAAELDAQIVNVKDILNVEAPSPEPEA